MAVSISISITQNSQSITDNTSNVTVKVKQSWTYGSWDHNNYTKSCTINGTTYYFSDEDVNPNKTTSGSATMFTKTLDIAHDDDGEKTLKVSASVKTGTSSGTVTASASKTLTTIPRKSTLSVTAGTLGTAQTLKITEKASAFVHKLKYTCGDKSGYIIGSSSSTSSTLSVSWTPPISLATENTTGTSVSIKFTLYTYSGSTLVGSNSYTKSFKIPSSVAPSISKVTISEAGGFTLGAYVQNHSKLKVVVEASGSQDSTIKTVATKVDGITYSGSTITTGIITSSGTVAVQVTVTDSRGRTDTETVNVTVQPYHTPTISAFTVERCDGNGNLDDSGEYAKITYNFDISTINNLNSKSVVIGYMNGTELVTLQSLSSYTGNSSFKTTTTFSLDYSYTFKIVVSDFFTADNPSELIDMIMSEAVILDIKANGKGIGIGRVAEKDGFAMFGWEIGAVEDIDWTLVTLNEAFVTYDNTSTPMYRVRNKVVELTGAVKPVTAYTSSATRVVFGTIPEEYAPDKEFYVLCQGSSKNTWLLTVKTDGELTISRYGVSSYVEVPTTAWLTFHVTYTLD